MESIPALSIRKLSIALTQNKIIRITKSEFVIHFIINAPFKKKSHFLTQSKFENCEKSEFAIFTDALFLLVISTYSCLVCTRSAGGVTLYRTETDTVQILQRQIQQNSHLMVIVIFTFLTKTWIQS